jgi:hypothetical protein
LVWSDDTGRSSASVMVGQLYLFGVGTVGLTHTMVFEVLAAPVAQAESEGYLQKRAKKPMGWLR